jgi:hypothetical protein
MCDNSNYFISNNTCYFINDNICYIISDKKTTKDGYE